RSQGQKRLRERLVKPQQLVLAYPRRAKTNNLLATPTNISQCIRSTDDGGEKNESRQPTEYAKLILKALQSQTSRTGRMGWWSYDLPHSSVLFDISQSPSALQESKTHTDVH
ncbi:unnamed protein product, partial [Ectocarpus sp. 6 AP-2014]